MIDENKKNTLVLRKDIFNMTRELQEAFNFLVHIDGDLNQKLNGNLLQQKKMIKIKSIVEIITECDRKDMSKEHPLLSDFLEELKVQYNGSNLNKYISIFYNDWSLNPYDEDDYSERVSIKGDVLKNINSKEFQNYKVLWYDPYIFDPNFIEICVKEMK